MALVSPQQASATGLNPTPGTPTTSETFTPDPYVTYHITIGATSTTVTLVVPGTQYGQARADVAVATAATNTTRIIGGFVPDLADPSTGVITVTFSQTTNVTAYAVRA